jgi:hypothetical protein
MRSRQTGSKLLFEASRDRITTTRQRPDDNPIRRVQLCYKRPRDMAQPPCHSVPLHRRSDGLRHDQPNAWAWFARLLTPLRMHNEIAFRSPHTRADRRSELRRPRHPVPRRKHRASYPRAGSGRQRPPALTPPVRHDRAPSARPHPQPESMHPRSPAVVRLEGALALCHGSISSCIWHLAASCTV